MEIMNVLYEKRVKRNTNKLAGWCILAVYLRKAHELSFYCTDKLVKTWGPGVASALCPCLCKLYF